MDEFVGEETAENTAKPLKRVQISALDFDWIFQENNASTLLSLLANDANNEVLTKRSIKIFIDLMWGHY
jgi:hypothetical protein